MACRKNPRMPYLIIGIVMIFAFGANWIELAFQRDDIWWTPREMMLSLHQCRNRVEVFVKDEPLKDVLTDGRLEMQTAHGTVALSETDIGFRINNWDRVQASQLMRVGLDSGATTLAAVFLLYGLAPFFSRRSAAGSCDSPLPPE